MNPNTVEPEKKETNQSEAKELDLNELGQVSGAGSPFDDIPRVPVKPIDDELRNKG